MNNLTRFALASTLAFGAASGFAACDDDGGGGGGGGSGGGTFPSGQVERLARPAVNEGLIFTNDLLNAFNAVPPSADLTPPAAPVVAEAVVTLTALGNDAQRVGDIAAAFLPDVMRIDTTIASPVGTAAYANGAVPFGSQGVVRPVAGRKLEDDVIDITLSVLIPGVAPTLESDNVGYEGVPGNEAQPGHARLLGQSVPLGPAVFPFLARAN